MHPTDAIQQQAAPSPTPQLPAVAPPPEQPMPAVPAPGAPVPVVVGSDGAPIVGMDAATLRNRRSELSRQLNSADSRRQELVEQLQDAPPGSQAGLVARIELLDQRILHIEQDIAQNGQALASLPASSTTADEAPMPPGELNSGQITAIAIVFIVFVLTPLAVAVGRMLWRRGTPPRQVAMPPVTEQRLERLEQGVDAIAVEVERISEGQRFVTRVLAEGRGGHAIGAAAEKVAVGRTDG